MSHDVEPTIIDYARFHGLVRDHRESPPLERLTLSENLGSSLDDPPELFHIDLAKVKLPQERWAVDAGAASLLSSIVESAQHPPPYSDEELGIDRHRVRRMKQELPLLRSDHELDVLRFASPIVPDLENEFLPLETVDVEEDEGFEWPSSYYALPDEFTKKSRSEKIEASQDDCLYLQQTLKYDFEGLEHGTFEYSDSPYKKVNLAHLCNRQVPLTVDRDLFQNQYHLHCYRCRPTPNLMYHHPRPAILISCPTLPVQPERKCAKLSK